MKTVYIQYIVCLATTEGILCVTAPCFNFLYSKNIFFKNLIFEKLNPSYIKHFQNRAFQKLI